MLYQLLLFYVKKGWWYVKKHGSYLQARCLPALLAPLSSVRFSNWSKVPPEAHLVEGMYVCIHAPSWEYEYDHQYQHPILNTVLGGVKWIIIWWSMWRNKMKWNETEWFEDETRSSFLLTGRHWLINKYATIWTIDSFGRVKKSTRYSDREDFRAPIGSFNDQWMWLDWHIWFASKGKERQRI